MRVVRRGIHASLFVVLASAGACTELAVVGTGGAGTTSSTSGAGNTSGPSSTTGGSPTTSTGATQSGASVSGSSSTGVMCAPADCSDGDPCTADTCQPTGLCDHAPRAPGTPGDLLEGPCEGVCQVDGTCGLAHYRRDFAAPTWTKAALSQVWAGANAPPPRGIVAADHGITFEVMVAADDGMIYRRFGGVWAAPVPSTTLLGIDATQITSFSSFDIFGGEFLFVFFVDGGHSKQSTFNVDGANVSLNTGPNDATDDDVPWATFPLSWSVFVTDAGGTAHFYYRLTDGNVYEWNGESYAPVPEAMSSILGDPLTAPTLGDVRAGLAEGTEIQLIAP